MAKQQKQELERAVEMIRKYAPEGTKVYTILRAVSKSGMSRTISAYVIKDGETIYLDGYIALILDLRHKQMAGTREGVYVTGAGMDMGFWLVYTLSRAVYGDGYALRHDWL